MAKKYKMDKLIPQSAIDKAALAKSADLFGRECGDPKLNALLGIEPEENVDGVTEIAISDIRDFGGEYGSHRFSSNPDKISELAESIAMSGVLTPLIVRRDGSGLAKYECLAGHTRKAAAEIAGLEKVPCIIKNVSDEEAEVIMVATNHQREDLLPVEKGWMYRIEYEAMKRKAGRKSGDEINGAQNEHHLTDKKKSIELLAEKSEDSRANIQRYIRCTYLIEFLADMVNAKKLPLAVASDLSYLTDNEQDHAFACAYAKRINISAEVGKALKEASKTAAGDNRTLTIDDVERIFMDNKVIKKKPSQAKYMIPDDYFPDDFDKDEKMKYIELMFKYVRDNNIQIKV